MKSSAMQDDHESYELKWAGERDADDYEKQVAQSRRHSLAFRNAEARRIRNLEANMKSSALQDDHESYELKWAGERDAEAYKRLQDRERRESLNFRGREAARHHAVMEELLSLAREREHESFMLKWAAENDSKQYLADQEELRRQSLAQRNAEARCHRDIDADMKVKALNELAKDEELKAACKCSAYFSLFQHRRELSLIIMRFILFQVKVMFSATEKSVPQETVHRFVFAERCILPTGCKRKMKSRSSYMTNIRVTYSMPQHGKMSTNM